MSTRWLVLTNVSVSAPTKPQFQNTAATADQSIPPFFARVKFPPFGEAVSAGSRRGSTVEKTLWGKEDDFDITKTLPVALLHTNKQYSKPNAKSNKDQPLSTCLCNDNGQFRGSERAARGDLGVDRDRKIRGTATRIPWSRQNYTNHLYVY